MSFFVIMAEDRQTLDMKEVQNPIIYAALANPEFINSVPEQASL
jgi:hypothetical protein